MSPIAEGIERVIADDAGHELTGGRIREVQIAPDGTVWVAQGRRVFALGEPGAIEPRSGDWRSFPRAISVAPGGAVWAMEDGGSVVTLEGSTWLDRSGSLASAGRSLGVLDDGSVWRVVRIPGEPHRIVRLGLAGWSATDSADLDAMLVGRGARYTFAQSSDGGAWLGVDRGDLTSGLAVFGADVWSEVESLGPIVTPRVLNVASGNDGVLWVLADLNVRASSAEPPDYVLAKFDGIAWSVYTAAEGLPQDRSGISLGRPPMLSPPMVVAHDGTVWFSIERVGLVSFDGETFGRVVVPGLKLGALDLAVGPKGHIWLASTRGALYVMTPAGSAGGPNLADPGSAPAAGPAR